MRVLARVDGRPISRVRLELAPSRGAQQDVDLVPESRAGLVPAQPVEVVGVTPHDLAQGPALVAAEIEAHAGVNQLFLNRCATSPFSKEDYKVFGENHYPLVMVFTSYLERLPCRAPSRRPARPDRGPAERPQVRPALDPEPQLQAADTLIS